MIHTRLGLIAFLTVAFEVVVIAIRIIGLPGGNAFVY